MDAAHREDSDDALRAIADPLQRALRLRAISRDRGTLTPSQAQIYREAVAEIRGDNERKQVWIARKLNLSRGRVAHLLSPKFAVKTTEAAA